MTASQVVSVEAQNTDLQITPMQMLNTAVSQGADLDKLEKLMNLQERWENSEAKKAFNEALAGFQAELGPIIKKREGHNCSYADIDDIAQAIRPILDAFGLAYRFEQFQENNAITVTCIVTHTKGHRESATLTALSDTSGGKNAIQAMASTVTYLRRYTLTGALGITTGSDDNDGGKPAVSVDELIEYNQTVRDEFPSIAAVKIALADGNYSSAKEAWHELDEQTQRRLWKAPTKGGIFTTAERTQMKSTDWSEA